MTTSSSIPTVKLLIDGEFIESTTQDWRDVVNPATQEVLARVPFATAEEIDRAVASAKEGMNDAERECRQRCGRPRAGTRPRGER